MFVEPTNNTAEQALRELIVQRKIIGGLKAEKGAKIIETITTMIATWKQQEKPLFSTLNSCIKKNPLAHTGLCAANSALRPQWWGQRRN